MGPENQKPLESKIEKNQKNKKLSIIANPAARKSSLKKVKLASELLGRAGWDVELMWTQEAGHATRLAKQAADGGAYLVVAAGGDGTFNEVMNGLTSGNEVMNGLTAGNEVMNGPAARGPAMALLPLGTTNVLAKELKVPEDARGAVQRILEGRVREIYLGSMSFPDGRRRRFFLMAGMGFDAEAVYQVNRRLKKLYGKAGYLTSGLKLLKSWAPEPKSVLIDGRQYFFSSLIVCNGARYGGYPKMAPDANVEDGWLYAVVMSGRKRLAVLKYALGVVTGRHTSFKDVAYLKCRSVQVQDTARIQADGDYIGESPVLIETAKEKLKLVY